jgi:hypothetical protein
LVVYVCSSNVDSDFWTRIVSILFLLHKTDFISKSDVSLLSLKGRRRLSFPLSFVAVYSLLILLLLQSVLSRRQHHIRVQEYLDEMLWRAFWRMFSKAVLDPGDGPSVPLAPEEEEAAAAQASSMETCRDTWTGGLSIWGSDDEKAAFDAFADDGDDLVVPRWCWVNDIVPRWCWSLWWSSCAAKGSSKSKSSDIFLLTWTGGWSMQSQAAQGGTSDRRPLSGEPNGEPISGVTAESEALLLAPLRHEGLTVS